jgi:hypothetical protein
MIRIGTENYRATLALPVIDTLFPAALVHGDNAKLAQIRGQYRLRVAAPVNAVSRSSPFHCRDITRC